VEIVPGGIEQWLAQPPENMQASSLLPFLHTDGHLGVPQKNLYQIYLSALRLLDMHDPGAQIDATCVILLANPAHQTALNIRKRLVQAGSSLSAHAELNFSSRLLLSSRPASKESILWAHRRWIFTFLYPRTWSAGLGVALTAPEIPEIPSDTIESEFQLISRCCEVYPRNYHAWSHHHFLVQCIHTSLQCSRPIETPYLPLLVREFLNIRRWIETHVSDYSAMHHFCSMALRLKSLDLPHYTSTLGEFADPAVHFEHAISLVTSFPSHESLWMYLRAVISISPENSNSFAVSAISLTANLNGLFRDRFISWVERRESWFARFPSLS
jgi:protein prenyltransferase alpha subunit repeat containing protein 1